MKLIHSNAELLEHPNPYKHVEAIGRTCYKSEAAITDDSCYRFVNNLIDHKHFAMLEHARFTFFVTEKEVVNFIFNVPATYAAPVARKSYDNHSFLWLVNVSMSHLYNPEWADEVGDLFLEFRQIVETYFKSPEKANPWRYIADIRGFARLVTPQDWSALIQTEEDLQHYRGFQYTTIKFICDRGVSHELVRHRCAVAQESTRYCNYSKDKFGNELTFIYPFDYAEWGTSEKKAFLDLLHTAESVYMSMIESGMTPQTARAVLPNSLKTEVILTMNSFQWDHFFALRKDGATGAPHPDMKRVATIAHSLYAENWLKLLGTLNVRLKVW